MTCAYYNENDPFAAQWLRNLIAAGLIADGDVDEQSITEVRPESLAGYTQCHFFAGIGVWSYALRLAEWPDDRPVWTGSCPCQPFSCAGQRKGHADERHLWPEWFRLIRECRPIVCFGEQVANALDWLDLVSGDLEGENYAIGSAIIGAHSVGAPHIRQRIYWVADSQWRGGHDWRRLHWGRTQESEWREKTVGSELWKQVEGECTVGGSLANSNGRESCNRELQRGREQRLQPQNSGVDSGMADSPESRRPGAGEYECRSSLQTARFAEHGSVGHAQEHGCKGRSIYSNGESPLGITQANAVEHSSCEQMGLPRCAWESGAALDNPTVEGLEKRSGRAVSESNSRGLAERSGHSSFWEENDQIWCIDGRTRPIEPGTFPLAHGSPNRVGRLRGYGNAIVAPQAQAFIEAYLDVCS